MTHLMRRTGAAHNTGAAVQHDRDIRKTHGARRHRIAALAGAGVLAVSVGVGAQATGESPAAAAPARGEQSRSSPGFAAVHTFGPVSREGTPIAMTAPGAATVFVLMEGKGGQAEVRRITVPNRGKGKPAVATYKLGTPLGAPERAGIDATSTSDVWVSANGAVWRFDGRRFSKVALPPGQKAVTVADAPGRDVYLGTESTAVGGRVWRGTVGRSGTVWTSAGHASREGFEEWGLPILDLRVVDGRVFGMWAQQYSALLSRVVYQLDSGTWTQRYLASTWHPSGGVRDYTWLTPKTRSHVVLGAYESPGTSPALMTSTWSGGEAAQCLRSTPSKPGSQKGAVLADGRLVTAGFRIRAKACDTDRPLAGNPGSTTLAMTAERGTNTAWAITLQGNRPTLQRFVG